MKNYLLLAGFCASMISSVVLAECKEIRGKIKSNHAQVCQSPIGICSAGTIKDAVLNGQTAFKATGLAATPSEPDMSTSFSYVGELTITTKKGHVHIKNMGVFDKKTNNFTETARDISGTGKFANITGNIFIHGQATATGYESKISGKLCY
jgi:hypothetical protein